MDVLKQYLPKGFINCGPPFSGIVTEIVDLASIMQSSQEGHIETVLLHGPKGTGKSGLAAHITSLLNFTFVKVSDS